MRLARTLSGRIPWAAHTNTGLVRRNNEDYYLSRPDLGLWILCDGLSGHLEGECASWVCALTIADHVAAGVDIVGAVYQAHWKVWRLTYDKSNQFDQCGTTVAVLRIHDRQWEIAWVGDTRIWLYDRNNFQQITKDHTVACQLMDWGEISVEEVPSHPERHRLTQVVGIAETPLDVGYKSGHWHAEQVFLLATDGLAYWNEPEKIACLLTNADNPAMAVERLTEASIEFGGKDNFSMIVVGQSRRKRESGRKLFSWLPFFSK